ncbi:hypothetical protein [Actinomycetospora cinnamomea]|uniref:Uncharacterized protein n=1 Tax=Actinomycetospora cinnamomea TaxID=663609 RepID=A0A2U1FBC9_9PSEU|nr:hypothetical protein [Actinomycetospora cinnamomea]PVZ09501.1 hypothetical protein C8D89_106164 [Actinomycetospora cinnamomea]
MPSDEGDEPADETALAGAVDEAMKSEIRRSLAPQFERLTLQHDEIRPPRDRQDEILDELRDLDPGDEPPE